MNIPDAWRAYAETVNSIAAETPEVEDAFTAGAERAEKEARSHLLTELRWLAAARAEYCHIDHTDVRAYLDASDMEQHIHQEHAVVEGVADILDGTNDGMGWLPSWRWDDWEALRSGSEGETR